MTSNRNKLDQLIARVRDAAKQQDPIASAVVEIVRLTHEELKESLVNADGNDIHRLQGAARHMQKLHKDLTISPPNIAAGANL